MSERVEVIDPVTGATLDTVERARVRSENLWHRSVFVVLLRSDGLVVTHRRADWKDMWPGRWDCAFGGVVAAGEATAVAAERELAEEAGVHGPALEHLGRGMHDDEDVREVGDVYLARWDGPLAPADGEVVELGTVPLAELDAWLGDTPVVPDACTIVAPLLRTLVGGAGS